MLGIEAGWDCCQLCGVDSDRSVGVSYVQSQVRRHGETEYEPTGQTVVSADTLCCVAQCIVNIVNCEIV